MIDHLTVALDSEYISEEEYNDIDKKIVRCLQILNGYINYLIKAKDKYPGNQTSEPEEYYASIAEPE